MIVGQRAQLCHNIETLEAQICIDKVSKALDRHRKILVTQQVDTELKHSLQSNVFYTHNILDTSEIGHLHRVANDLKSYQSEWVPTLFAFINPSVPLSQ